MLVMGFKYFNFSKGSAIDRVDCLVGSIIGAKFKKDDITEASKLYKVLKKKEKRV